MDHARLDRLPQEELPGGLRLARADDWRSRLLGLTWLDFIRPELALRISPCRSIHTFGMRFALDLIWLDEDGAVVVLDRGVPPRRVRGCGGARSVIETRARHADRFVEAIAARPA